MVLFSLLLLICELSVSGGRGEGVLISCFVFLNARKFGQEREVLSSPLPSPVTLTTLDSTLAHRHVCYVGYFSSYSLILHNNYLAFTEKKAFYH